MIHSNVDEVPDIKTIVMHKTLRGVDVLAYPN